MHPINLKLLKQQFAQLSDAELGAAFKAFIIEAEHGSWDGWDSDEERRVIEQLLNQDLSSWLEQQ